MGSTALAQVANRLAVSESELQSIVINTVMPNKGQQVSNDQFISFMAVANEYKLNPLVKEIYAFPAKGGGIQPIVSIDGWLKIITNHEQFDGMEHEDILDNGSLVAIKCSIYRKDAKRPITVTEYMNECRRGTDTWKQWPNRMLRHKATIQAGRYAFGISGIVDPDEAERIKDAASGEREINPAPASNEKPVYTQDQFNENANKMANAIGAGRKTPEDFIQMIESQFTLPEEIRQQIETIVDVAEEA
jgi:phage recombination protein Bet